MDIQSLLKLSVQQNASDLHVSVGMQPAMRIDGEIHFLDQERITAPQILAFLDDIIDQAMQNQLRQGVAIDVMYHLKSVGRFRCNIYQHCDGLSIACRVMPAYIASLAALGASDKMLELMQLKQGLILVTGATGSGKTTTLAAMIDQINTQRACHIITIEDPIEVQHTNKKSLIHQRQVQRDVESFDSALHSALRQDPDVLLVGELRDLSTIKLALTAAETGHLVLATLHTRSAVQSVHRIMDVFQGTERASIRSLLAESLKAVISQQLIKKQQGGRVAAFEVLYVTTAIRHLIREDNLAQMYSAMQTGRHQGMQTMEQALMLLRQQHQLVDTVEREHAGTVLPYAELAK
tara:strand:- start:3236 stop:4285 length:1050 start_codon:yes stop_codon:yes gene_type:complete